MRTGKRPTTSKRWLRCSSSQTNVIRATNRIDAFVISSQLSSKISSHAWVLNVPPPPAKLAFDSGLILHHQHVHFMSGYIANVHPITQTRRIDVNIELRSLKPTAKVTAIVVNFDQQRFRHSYGIHTWSRTLANDNLVVNNDCGYTKSGALAKDYWRLRSQLRVFIHMINQKLRLRKRHPFSCCGWQKVIRQGEGTVPWQIRFFRPRLSWPRGGTCFFCNGLFDLSVQHSRVVRI